MTDDEHEHGISRREALAGGALATGGLLVASAPASARSAPRPRRVDVVVVGAGLAGLSAATRGMPPSGGRRTMSGWERNRARRASR